MCDPRDLGFNYSTGWGSAPKPPVYLYAMKLARQLGQEVVEKSAQAWALEMALRNVRLATTGAEKAVAVAALVSQMNMLNEIAK
jgi:hypothetical protein